MYGDSLDTVSAADMLNRWKRYRVPRGQVANAECLALTSTDVLDPDHDRGELFLLDRINQGMVGGHQFAVPADR